MALTSEHSAEISKGEVSHDEVAEAMTKADVGIPHADIVYLLQVSRFTTFTLKTVRNP